MSRLSARFGLVCSLGLAVSLAFSGCQEVGFYRQAIGGEYEIMAHRKPIQQLIDDPATPPRLKAKFQQILKIRQFATQELKLPGEKSYLNYTDLHRPYVVWNVNVAPALSVEPKTWWFPVVGRASYRGYFHEAAAQHYAAKWENRAGWDVYVDGVETYSTLGWFRDPLLNTFIFEPEEELAETIFHELGHQRLFVAGDTDFNEAFATSVASEGIRRWCLAAGNPNEYGRYQTNLLREKQFVQLVMGARAQLELVYTNPHLSDAIKLQRKQEVIAHLRGDYTAVKKTWGGAAGYDYWFAEPINNAKLNTVSSYYDLVPAFQALIRQEGGDMEKFYAVVKDLAKLSVTKRHEALQEYLKSN